MSPKFKSTRLPGVLLVEPEIHRDFRGYFLEISQKLKYEAGGIPTEFVQTNFSSSVKGTLRGLHYQYQNPQGKLLTVLQGEIFDVAVDVRPNSPTFREWVGVRLRAEDKGQIFVPAGFAHGFCVLSERADVFYQCTDY
ncbi:MAG: dTDP-4-dehydrorhamnose 3,5-epimerase, partial [Deltaproteobacteria bacterium]|nr:dTDP-4-dehydrorhamnose 3,5-epimerase [Deltaproteobacteria bacterium]